MQLRWPLTSEEELNCSLTYASRTTGEVGQSVISRNLSEVRRPRLAPGVIRVGELRAIEGIEHFPPDLQPVAFFEVEVLREVQICFVPTRPEYDVTSRVPECTGRIRCKCSGIEILVQPVRLPALMDIQRHTRDPVSQIGIYTRA